MDYIQIIALISSILLGLVCLLIPVVIGKPRPPYSYGNWIGSLVEFGLILLMTLRIFGKL